MKVEIDSRNTHSQYRRCLFLREVGDLMSRCICMYCCVLSTIKTKESERAKCLFVKEIERDR